MHPGLQSRENSKQLHIFRVYSEINYKEQDLEVSSSILEIKCLSGETSMADSLLYMAHLAWAILLTRSNVFLTNSVCGVPNRWNLRNASIIFKKRMTVCSSTVASKIVNKTSSTYSTADRALATVY
jgi:hypothetical protein